MAPEQSVFDAQFLSSVKDWFSIYRDIFVVARYSAMAGTREYFWFKDFESFRVQIDNLPPQTDVIVFRENQFPLRGIVDDNLIRQALEQVPDDTETMVTSALEPPNDSIHIWACDTHAELLETLRDLVGEYAAIGFYAAWHRPDNEKMISALVPLPDGTLKRGVY